MRDSKTLRTTIASLVVAVGLLTSLAVAGTGVVAADGTTITTGDDDSGLEASAGQVIEGTTDATPGTTLTVEVRGADDEAPLATGNATVDSNGTFATQVDLGTVAPGTDVTVTVTNGSTTLAETTATVLPTRTGFRDYIVETTSGETATMTVYLPEHDSATLVLGNESAIGYEHRATVHDANGDGIVTLTLDTAALGSEGSALAADGSSDRISNVSQIERDSTLGAGEYTTTLTVGSGESAQTSVGTLVLTAPETTTTEEPTTTSSTTDQPTESTTSTESPGFGIGVVLAGIVGAALVALGRSR